MDIFVDFIASVMFIDENRQTIENMSKPIFMTFICTIIEIWCDKHGSDMTSMVRDICEVVENVRSR